MMKNNNDILKMTFNKNVYKDKIALISEQIFINWSLIKYAQLSNNESYKININHWKSELLGNFHTTARYNLKKNNSYEYRINVIRESWTDNDFINPVTLVFVLANKFKKENIDRQSIEFQQTIYECLQEFNTFIELIAKQDIDIIDIYVDNL